MGSQGDYYKILGVNRSATQEEIRTAYLNLAKKVHPDKNSDYYAEGVFKDIEEANSVLSDPAKRAEYDLSSSRGNSYRKEKGERRERETAYGENEGYANSERTYYRSPQSVGWFLRSIGFYAGVWIKIWHIENLWLRIPLMVLYALLSLSVFLLVLALAFVILVVTFAFTILGFIYSMLFDDNSDKKR